MLLEAKPAAGEAWTAWKGYCQGMPGPVCQYFQTATARSTTLVLGRAGKRASISTKTAAVVANTPNCAFDHTLTVTGRGFAHTAAATLRDDGNVVASGTTTSTGTVSLTYSVATSEPGLYRTLSLTAGTATATSDVGNVTEVCVGGGAPAGGKTSFVVGDSGNDANGSLTFRFGSNPTVVVHNGTTGDGVATTPLYTCPVGKVIDWHFSGSSAVGTKWAFHFSIAVPFPCPATAAARPHAQPLS